MLLEQTTKYSVTSAIIWYSVLVASIILFILYIKFFNAKNKGYKKAQARLGREITRLEYLVKSVKDTKGLDSLRKTQLVIANFTNTLDEIATTTNLDDVNEAIKLAASVSKKIKKVDTSNKENYLNNVNDIIIDLSKLNSMFIIILGIIKK